LATACLLCSLVLVTGRRTWARDGAAIILLVVALLTKETAVSGVVFVAIWSLLIEDRRERTDRLWLSLVAAAVTVLYVGWRLFAAGSRFDNQPSTTRRGIAHFLTSPFAALGSPWSSVDLAAWPIAGVVPCLLLIAAIVAFVLQPRPRRQVVTAVVLLLCALVAVAPVGRYFFVGPDLEGSRYLYLPSAFLTLAVGYLLTHTTVRHARARVALVAAVVVLFAAGMRAHLRPWERAAESRDALLESMAQTVEHGACSTVAV